MRISALAAALAVAAALSAGCGGGTGGVPGAGDAPTGKQAMDDLADLLRGAAEQKKRPPARPADLAQYEAVHLSATLAVTRQDVVYAWGTGLTGGPAVVAYQKDAPTNGGYVLLQDGTVKQMTAAEFAAAPKAGGKK